MFTEMSQRPYKMQKRAASQDRTRQKIVEATVELHGSVGPKNTSISAVARRAGVRRLTVYRHFPDEFALFSACSSHWMSTNPPPDPAAWMGIADPERRTAAALTALYGYYRKNAAMIGLVFRDVAEVEALRAPVDAFVGYLRFVCDDIAAAWHPKGRKPQPLVATVAHAVAFSTWQSLGEPGMPDAKIVRLVLLWIAASAD